MRDMRSVAACNCVGVAAGGHLQSLLGRSCPPGSQCAMCAAAQCRCEQHDVATDAFQHMLAQGLQVGRRGGGKVVGLIGGLWVGGWLAGLLGGVGSPIQRLCLACSVAGRIEVWQEGKKKAVCCAMLLCTRLLSRMPSLPPLPILPLAPLFLSCATALSMPRCRSCRAAAHAAALCSGQVGGPVYRAVLSAHLERSRWAEALRLLDEMKAHGAEADAEVSWALCSYLRDYSHLGPCPHGEVGWAFVHTSSGLLSGKGEPGI